jgi:hypothetical protein
MRVFPLGVEHALDVTIQCPEHADPRMHHEVPALSGRDQDADRPPACSSLVSHVGTARRDLFEIRIVIKDGLRLQRS